MANDKKGRLAGKRAVITGGAQGLGACFARLFLAEGAQVALTDINEEKARQTAEELSGAYPGAVTAHAHDVVDPDQWDSVLAASADAMSGIDILVNNAGIASVGSIESESFENYRRVMAIDTDSIFLGCQKAMPYLREGAPASIVNISSISGLIADGNLIAYNTAKAAVAMMTKSIALHCAQKRYEVRCNSVHPVFVRTPILDGFGRDDALGR